MEMIVVSDVEELTVENAEWLAEAGYVVEINDGKIKIARLLGEPC